MVEKKRMLDTELRQELSKETCHEIMDFLMVEFRDETDYHYNYYFDNDNGDLSERDITLRLRSAVKGKTIRYALTLKVPTIEKDTFLEYNQALEEREMRLLAYNNVLPEGEIGELTSIHGGKVKLINVIKVTRTTALYQNMRLFFDRIGHKGKTFFEMGTRIDRSGVQRPRDNKEKFIALLKKFDIDYVQAPRRSKKFKNIGD